MKPVIKAISLFAIPALIGVLTFAQSALAQVNPVSIRFPDEGAAVQGVVTIEGNANPDDFRYYQLSFSYADVATQTWFLISEPSNSPVANGPLALWDTTTIVDGNYRLRLEVVLADGSSLESIVENIRVRNTTPIETNTPAPVVKTQTPSPIPLTPTSFPTPISFSTTNGETSVLLNMCLGAFIASVLLAALAAYIQTSRATRLSLGALKMRWLLWREDRRRRGKKL